MAGSPHCAAVARPDLRGSALIAGDATPENLALRLMFFPLAELLAQVGAKLPTADGLNALSQLTDHPPCSQRGQPIRFVPPDRSRLAYEERVFTMGEIVTRPDSWHDFFNALVWMRFPRTKAALNALHGTAMQPGASRNRRGPLRDAATQFDESGIVVASADEALLELLAKRRWKELFWARRAEVGASMRFMVIGHGLYDALRAPFYRMCGRAALIEVPQSTIDGDVDLLCERVDEVLAQRFAERNLYPSPRMLPALPILGIPGVSRQSECPQYYDDAVQFCPPSAWRTP